MITVLYHKNCTDGIISALIPFHFYKTYNVEATYIPINYNEENYDLIPQECKSLFFVDFCPKMEDIVSLGNKFDNIFILDHHDTAIKNVSEIIKEPIENYYFNNEFLKDQVKGRISLELDQHRSGATMSFDFFKQVNMLEGTSNQYIDRLEIIANHVADRDLWKFKFPGTRAYYEAINSFPKDLEILYKELVLSSDENFIKLLNKAEHFIEIKAKLAKEYASKFEMIEFMGYTIPVSNCPANFASDVGHILAQDNPFSLTYCLNSQKVYCSLRGNALNDIAVNEIAKVFGGGGHVKSAGFGIRPEQLIELLKGNIKSVV